MGLEVLFVVKEIEGAEPLGALDVAGCLAQAGHECRFFDKREHRKGMPVPDNLLE